MLLTVAAGYKYNPVQGRSLREVFTEVLHRSDIRLVAIGPNPGHSVFGPLAERFPGRVEALGVIPDPDHFRAAADVYLDSYPFCSPTSLLESALRGTPVVAFQPDFKTLEVLYDECPGVDRSDFAAEDPSGLSGLVSALLDSSSRRESILHAFRRGVQPHLPEQWRANWAEILPLRSSKRDWTAPNGAEASGLLDVTLAGLGKNPFDFLRRSRWTVTDLQTRLQLLAARLRYLL